MFRVFDRLKQKWSRSLIVPSYGIPLRLCSKLYRVQVDIMSKRSPHTDTAYALSARMAAASNLDHDSLHPGLATLMPV